MRERGRIVEAAGHTWQLKRDMADSCATMAGAVPAGRGHLSGGAQYLILATDRSSSELVVPKPKNSI